MELIKPVYCTLMDRAFFIFSSFQALFLKLFVCTENQLNLAALKDGVFNDQIFWQLFNSAFFILYLLALLLKVKQLNEYKDMFHNYFDETAIFYLFRKIEFNTRISWRLFNLVFI